MHTISVPDENEPTPSVYLESSILRGALVWRFRAANETGGVMLQQIAGVSPVTLEPDAAIKLAARLRQAGIEFGVSEK